MKRDRVVIAVALAVCAFSSGCGESKYGKLPAGQRTVAEYCEGLGGTVVMEEGQIVNIEFVENVDNLTDEALARIAKVKSVKKLYFVSTQITDAGLRNLTGLTDLETLDVSGSQNITDTGLEHLKQIGSLKKLICRGCSQITKGKTKQLKEYFKENHGYELLITGPS